MYDLSYTEENYLKALHHLQLHDSDRAENFDGTGTNELAEYLEVKPASVTDMLKRLRAKELINYQPYKKITLTDKGRLVGLRVIRKHRLWECFLSDKLSFKWDEVHEVAEQLEHIKSPKLIERLDAFLGYPEYDPHGDPIPRPDGSMPKVHTMRLGEGKLGVRYRVVAVKDNSVDFLQYASQLGLRLNANLEIVEKIPFDHSMRILLNGKKEHISGKFASQVMISDWK
jgi:DtxR family Mn-dependent transcriptional regulator